MYRIFFIFISIIMSGSAYATTFDEYLERLEHHPQVTSILADSDKFRQLSASEMGLPDPQLILGVDNVPANDPAFDRFLPTSKVLGFNQQIPSYGLRKAKSEKQAGLSRKQKLFADYMVKRLKAIFITELADLDRVKKLEKFAQEQLKYYEELENYLKGQLESGQSVYGRFSEVDVERTEVEQRLNDLSSERVGIESELIRLVGEVPDIPVPEVPHMKWDRNTESLYPIQIAREDIDVASKDVKAANAAFGPNYGINALYKVREDGRNFAGDDWFSVQATVSIPLWYHWNQKPKLRAAEAMVQNSKLNFEDTKRMWIKKLSSMQAEHDGSLANIALLKEKQQALKEMVAAAKRKYEAGNADLESVLDVQIDMLTVASHLAGHHKHHIQLAAEFASYYMGESK